MTNYETIRETALPLSAAETLKKAIVFKNSGKYESALMAIEEALKIHVNYDDAWFMKGVILGMLGKCTESLKCYDKVIEINPARAF